MPLREIALVLDRSLTAVKVLLFRARKTLLPALRDFDEPLPPSSAGGMMIKGNTDA